MGSGPLDGEHWGPSSQKVVKRQASKRGMGFRWVQPLAQVREEQTEEVQRGPLKAQDLSCPSCDYSFSPHLNPFNTQALHTNNM